MRINTNISSLRALRFLGNTTKQFSATLEKLSSGRRINSARDDVSGMAVSNGLTAQIRGMRQNILNVNQSVGYLTTSDGVLENQGQIVQRMRELAIQAANGTLSDNDRGYLNTEFQQLMTEFDRLGRQSTYGSVSLLSNSMNLKLQVGTQKNQDITVTTLQATSGSVFTKYMPTYDFTVDQSFAASLGLSVVDDFNGDGTLDIVASNGSFSIGMYAGLGNGLFSNARNSSFGNGFSPADLQKGDFDGDGDVDFIATAPINLAIFTTIYINDGRGTFASSTTTTGTFNTRIAVGDFNKDGYDDYVSNDVGGNAYFHMSAGNGTFLNRVTVGATAAEINVVADDFNNDGNLDFAVESWASGYVYLGNGDGTFQSVIATPALGGRCPVKSADLNGDGIKDLVQSSEGSAFWAYSLGNGNGTFGTVRTIATTGNSRNFEIVDFDGDGDTDVVTVGSGASATLQVFENDGSANFTSKSKTLSFTLTAGTERAISATDFDGDGLQEIIASGDSSFQVISTAGSYQSAVSQLSLSKQSKAENVLSILDNALDNIALSRATIGAMMNRLESVDSVTAVGLENIQSARSAILDADISSETAEFARLQILNQASVATLTQANIEMRMVLNLINNN